MRDIVKTVLQGNIKIFIDDKLELSENNAIHADAIELLTRCMVSGFGVTTIEVSGDFTEVNRGIVDYTFQDDISMLFITTFYEDDFEGTITNLKLYNQALGLTLATKNGLSLYKGNTARVRIEWTVKITNS